MNTVLNGRTILRERRKSLTIYVVWLFGLFMAPSPAVSGDIVWGVNGHPLTAYNGVSLEQQVQLVRDLRMRSYRVDVNAVGQADMLGQLIRTAKAQQLTILPVLIPPINLDKTSEADVLTQARAFARFYVARFKADVPVWELGNESENYAIIQPCEKRDDGTIYPCSWGPAGGTIALDYYGPRAAKVTALLRGLSEGARMESATARLAIGSAGWGHVGIFDRLSSDGIKWDITVWHLYGTEYEWALKRLATFAKPIWVTEFNHPFGSAKEGERAQADGIRTLMTSLQGFAAKYRIEAAFIYELIDETYWAPSFEASMGLVGLTALPDGRWTLGTRKQAFKSVVDALQHRP